MESVRGPGAVDGAALVDQAAGGFDRRLGGRGIRHYGFRAGTPRASESYAGMNPAAEPPPDARGAAKTIIVVEDEVLVRLEIADYLRDGGRILNPDSSPQLGPGDLTCRSA